MSRGVFVFSFVGSVVAWLLLLQRRKRIKNTGVGSSHPSATLVQYRGCVYLDYNATTPIWPEVSEAMAPYTITSFGNPSSPHVYAAPCKLAVSAPGQPPLTPSL
jgi:cysteine desulfurase